MSDRNTIPDRHEVRHFRDLPAGRARGDHQAGEAIRQGDARVAHLLLDIGVDQRAEDLQDRPRQSVRPQMCHSRDRRCRRADPHVCRRIASRGTALVATPKSNA